MLADLRSAAPRFLFLGSYAREDNSAAGTPEYFVTVTYCQPGGNRCASDTCHIQTDWGPAGVVPI